MKETAIVSKNIKRLMILNDLNQAELAKRAGLSEATISRYVNGTRLPSSRVLGRLTKALNCTSNDLFEDEYTKLELIFYKMYSCLEESEKEYLMSILKR